MATTVDYDSNSDRVMALILGETFAGMVDAAEFVLTESNAVVPHDVGDLERSGAVTQDRANDTVAISYDTVYAVAQHEELTWKHAPGRKAKYLEGAVDENRQTALAIIGTRARRATGGL